MSRQLRLHRAQAAPQEQLAKLRQRLDVLPDWLREALDAYLRWRWPTWRAQTAYMLGGNLIGLFRRFWMWTEEHRSVDGWQTLRRADLQAWVTLPYRCGRETRIHTQPTGANTQLYQVRSTARLPG